MDEIMIKKKKKHLKLQNYAHGRHVAALKVVHFLNDEDGDFSHSLFHSHNFYELIAVVSGSGIHEINDQSYPLHPGSVFLLSPKDCHRYEYSESLTVLNFMFDSAVLRPFRSFLAHVPGYDHLFGTFIDIGDEIEGSLNFDLVGRKAFTFGSDIVGSLSGDLPHTAAYLFPIGLHHNSFFYERAFFRS